MWVCISLSLSVCLTLTNLPPTLLSHQQLIDLARSMPAESPIDTPHLPHCPTSIYFRMLRPELLVAWKRRGGPALSPDAFSGWSHGEPDAEQHNANARAATVFMLQEVIPSFAKEMEPLTLADLPNFHLSRRMHAAGIPMRHSGLLRSLVTNKHSRQVLLVEIVGRTLKNSMRAAMRKQLHDTSSHPNLWYKDHLLAKVEVVKLLSLITGCSEHSRLFWGDYMIAGVEARFGGVALMDAERADLFAAISADIYNLVTYVAEATGVVLASACLKSLKQHPVRFQFVESDVLDLRVRLRNMSIIDAFDARRLVVEAELAADDTTRVRLLSLAVSLFDTALRADPLDAQAKKGFLFAQARVQSFEAELLARFAESDSFVINAMKAARGHGFEDTVVAIGLFVLTELWPRRISRAPGRHDAALLARNGASTSLTVNAFTDIVSACLDERLQQLLEKFVSSTVDMGDKLRSICFVESGPDIVHKQSMYTFRKPHTLVVSKESEVEAEALEAAKAKAAPSAASVAASGKGMRKNKLLGRRSRSSHGKHGRGRERKPRKGTSASESHAKDQKPCDFDRIYWSVSQV